MSQLVSSLDKQQRISEKTTQHKTDSDTGNDVIREQQRQQREQEEFDEAEKIHLESSKMFFYYPKYLHPEAVALLAQNLLDNWESKAEERYQQRQEQIHREEQRQEEERHAESDQRQPDIPPVQQQQQRQKQHDGKDLQTARSPIIVEPEENDTDQEEEEPVDHKS